MLSIGERMLAAEVVVAVSVDWVLAVEGMVCESDLLVSHTPIQPLSVPVTIIFP